MKKGALYNVKHLKEFVVKPYLRNLNINRNQNSCETFDEYLNGWLPPEGIQVISKC
jgi:hypothetical protein